MSKQRRWRVTIPHEYQSHGETKTAFASVGIAFQNKKSISLKFYCNVIVNKANDIVLFPLEDEDGGNGVQDGGGNDEIPF